jgi:hypothetical protein
MSIAIKDPLWPASAPARANEPVIEYNTPIFNWSFAEVCGATQRKITARIPIQMLNLFIITLLQAESLEP